MVFSVRSILFGIMLALAPSIALADYLTVERSATIKTDPASGADVLEHPVVGTVLVLLDAGQQTDGYYHVTDPATQQSGWIYRTLVALQAGDPPVSPTPTPTPPPTPTSSIDTMTVHYINMGQGNAALLEFSCGAILIDAGGQNEDTTNGLIAYLKAFFLRRTDLNNTLAAILITHTHTDHNLALRSVVENFTVQHYVFNGHTKGSGRPNAVWMVAHANDAGRHVAIDTVTEANVKAQQGAFGDGDVDPLNCTATTPQIKILAGPYAQNPGWSALDYKNENNASLVIRVDFGQSSFLFPGDEEEAAIGSLLAADSGSTLLKADVWEVGHHGSYNGISADLLAQIKPQIAVISMGNVQDHRQWTAWQYGHPRKTTIDLLNAALSQTRASISEPVATGAKAFVDQTITAAIYATGWDGTIDITADTAAHYTVTTEHAP